MIKHVKITLWMLLLACFPLLLLGCGNAQQGKSPEYDQIKQMVKDIIQTEDGQKAIGEALKKEEFKEQILINSDEIKKTVEESVLSPKGLESFKKMMEDPKFAAELAKGLQKENEKLHKDLMKDPEYQKMMIDIMKDPDFEKNMLELMKSNAYRQQMMTVIKESLQSPMFQEDLLKIMTKVQEESMKPKKKEGEGGGSEGGGGGGGASDGGTGG